VEATTGGALALAHRIRDDRVCSAEDGRARDPGRYEAAAHPLLLLGAAPSGSLEMCGYSRTSAFGLVGNLSHDSRTAMGLDAAEDPDVFPGNRVVRDGSRQTTDYDLDGRR
jgi:hypothetical protein